MRPNQIYYARIIVSTRYQIHFALNCHFIWLCCLIKSTMPLLFPPLTIKFTLHLLSFNLVMRPNQIHYAPTIVSPFYQTHYALTVISFGYAAQSNLLCPYIFLQYTMALLFFIIDYGLTFLGFAGAAAPRFPNRPRS